MSHCAASFTAESHVSLASSASCASRLQLACLRVPVVIVALALLVVASGCVIESPYANASGTTQQADAAVTNDAAAAQVVMTDANKLAMRVAISPDDPPSRGVSTVSLQLSNPKTGAPEDGLDVKLVPWMPAHTHGTSVVPVVTPHAGGAYEISEVNLFMGGEWELRITISGRVTDRVTLRYQVP